MTTKTLQFSSLLSKEIALQAKA